MSIARPCLGTSYFKRLDEITTMVKILAFYANPAQNGSLLKLCSWSTLIGRHFWPGMSQKPFLSFVIYIVCKPFKWHVTMKGLIVPLYQKCRKNCSLITNINKYYNRLVGGGTSSISQSIPNISWWLSTLRIPCITNPT